MHYRLVVFCICLLSATNIFAQDTLPRFSAISKGNGKVIISWRNEFRSLSQISIQRSFDSIKNFTSLITVPDPSIAQNGFVDAKAPNPGMYYRLFIVMENGSYLFTKSKKASAAELQLPIENEPADKNEIKLKSEDQRITYHQKSNAAKISGPAKINGAPTVEVDKIIFITRNDSLIGQVSGKTLKHFRDSIINKTKDTLA